MRTVHVGKSVLRSSRLGYGCWRITGNPEAAGITPEHEATARRAILAAYEAGYTLFDHADIYASGDAETVFGKVLKEAPELRDRVLVSSKCGIRRHGDPDPTAPYRYDFSARHIIESCEASLTRLGLERIDLYQLHRPDFLGDPHEVAEAFGRLHKAGKVREFGLSNFSAAQVKLYQKIIPHLLVVNQVEISLARLDALTNGTLDQCLADKITPIAWAPLAGGRLASSDPIDLREPDHAHRLQLRETTDLVARNHGVSRGCIALAWLLQHPSQIIPLIGSTNPDRIRDYAKADEVPMSREEWYRLLEAGLGHRLA